MLKVQQSSNTPKNLKRVDFKLKEKFCANPYKRMKLSKKVRAFDQNGSSGSQSRMKSIHYWCKIWSYNCTMLIFKLFELPLSLSLEEQICWEFFICKRIT